MSMNLKHEGQINIVNQMENPVSIVLSRGAKGGYGWELKIHTDSFEKALEELGKADKALRKEYAPEEQLREEAIKQIAKEVTKI